MTLIERLQQPEGFSAAEQAVIEKILESPELVQDMSIRDLATASFASTTTIIRICKKLGYDGYKDFKIAFIMEITTNKLVHQTVNYARPFDQGQNTSQIINNLSSLYGETIDLITSLLDPKQLNQITDVLINSNRIFIFAVGDSRITAEYFINKLMKLNIYAILATENYQEISTAYNMTRADCALFISYKALSRNYTILSEVLKSRGIPIITLTGNDEAILTENSTYAIVIPEKETQFKIATFYSQLAFEFICSVLYSMIFSNNYSKHHQHKNIIDNGEVRSRVIKNK